MRIQAVGDAGIASAITGTVGAGAAAGIAVRNARQFQVTNFGAAAIRCRIGTGALVANTGFAIAAGATSLVIPTGGSDWSLNNDSGAGCNYCVNVWY